MPASPRTSPRTSPRNDLRRPLRPKCSHRGNKPRPGSRNLHDSLRNQNPRPEGIRVHPTREGSLTPRTPQQPRPHYQQQNPIQQRFTYHQYTLRSQSAKKQYQSPRPKVFQEQHPFPHRPLPNQRPPLAPIHSNVERRPQHGITRTFAAIERIPRP